MSIKAIDTFCPVCSTKYKLALAVQEPEPGNHSVCFSCGSFLILDTDYRLKLMTEVEIVGLKDSMRILMQRLRTAVNATKRH
jgi:hypothetical protein